MEVLIFGQRKAPAYMPKYKGFLKFTGSVGPITVYQLNGEWVARQRHGPNAKTMAENENYAPQRNHGREFGGVSRASKLMRDGFRRLAKEMADPEMHGRMTKTLNAIKNLDTRPKGERSVSIGMQRPEGRAMLRGWNANSHGRVWPEAVQKLDIGLATHTLTLLHADVAERGKTVEVTVVWQVVDFEKGIFKAEEALPVLLIPGDEGNWQRPPTLDNATGFSFIVLATREMIKSGDGWMASGDRRKMGLVVV